ncbi:hypothetical protein EV363DRAFT_1325365 [Boletus edulis]|nr:hypothetical protein EV363DRAFT_1325365 [Boletus edulis]
MRAIYEPTDPFTLPFLPMPPSMPGGSPEPSQHLHAQAIHDPAVPPIPISQSTSKSLRRGPQKSAAKTGSQKRKNTGKATLTPVTRSTIPEKGVPLTQAPPTEPRVSKRVPVKSKRNEVADAIGTNNMTFVDANKAAGGVGEHTSHSTVFV